MLLSIALLVLLLGVYSIPSGKQCPECEKYLTHFFKATAKRKDTNTEVALEFDHCFHCSHSWNMKEDGVPVDKNGNKV